MSEKYSKHSSKSSRKNKDVSTKSKTRKSSCHTFTTHSKGSKTPPIPSRPFEMENLLKKRHSLKQELERLEQKKDRDHFKSKHSIKEEGRKRKHSEDTSIKNLKPHRDKFTKNSKYIDLSPNYQDFHIDSEDEEDIIEQRRKQRKELIEKFYQNDKVPQIKQNENNSKIEQNKTSSSLGDLKSKHGDNNDNSKLISITDMFSEHDFVHKNITGTMSKEENNTQLTDNWDDPEGYYNIRIGDILNKKYTIKDILGQGVFANVVRVQDIKNTQVFAVKIVRNNDLMYKTSLKEICILKEINDADPDNKHHCIKFFAHFMHKGHLCLLLEPLHMDMRNVLKKYGKHHGLHMKALISYSRQLLIALRLLKKVGIIHADIKPDNILVNEKKNVLKLCDFGSASKLDENELTPYLVSRFYRAPEIILGITYSHGIDIWSTACTIYEMATGKILFTGNSNNRMLKCFMDLKGKISSKLIRKGKFKDQHFNYNNNFLLHKKDELSGRDKVVEINNIHAVRDLYKELLKSCKNVLPGEEKKLTQLKDILEKMLILDPNQRASVNDCLKHVFIQQELEK